MGLLILLGVASSMAIFAWHGAPGPTAPPSRAPVAPIATFKPKPAGDAELKAKACAAANSYVAALRKAGLPAPPGWDGMNCDQRVAATATLVGGGSLAGMIQAAGAAIAGLNSNTIADQTKAAVDRWTGGRL